MNFTMHTMDPKQPFWKYRELTVAGPPRQDFAVLAPLSQEYHGMWKPQGCDLVILGLCEDYAKGLLSITFHSSIKSDDFRHCGGHADPAQLDEG